MLPRKGNIHGKVFRKEIYEFPIPISIKKRHVVKLCSIETACSLAIRIMGYGQLKMEGWDGISIWA
jgi:hypothetical protein